MLTQNGKAMILGSLAGIGIGLTSFKNTIVYPSSSSSMKNFMSGSYLGTNTMTSVGYNVCFLGSGTTKETTNDINLEEMITDLKNNSFTCSHAITGDDGFGNEQLRFIATFTNNTTSEKIVSEIGLFYFATAGANNKVLFYRKTFNPVTIAVGETKTFTIILH